MDMRLPDISGFGLAAILKKHPVSQECTHSCGHRVGRRLSPGSGVFRQAATDFISKPFAISVLQRCLTESERPQKHQEQLVVTGLETAI